MPPPLHHTSGHQEGVLPHDPVKPPHAPGRKGYMELPLAGPLFKDIDAHDLQHMFLDLPRDLSDAPHLSHSFDDKSDR